MSRVPLLPDRLPTGQRLRFAEPNEAEALHSLYRAAYSPGEDEARARLPGGRLLDTLEDVRAYLGEHAVLVALDEADRIVGSVALRSVANVRRLAVDPRGKRLGLGGALLEAAVDLARREGFDFAALDTLCGHPWLPSFYSRHGFEARSVERLPDGSEWLVMRRRLR